MAVWEKRAILTSTGDWYFWIWQIVKAFYTKKKEEDSQAFEKIGSVKILENGNGVFRGLRSERLNSLALCYREEESFFLKVVDSRIKVVEGYS